MIESDSRANIPVVRMERILEKNGLFPVRSGAGEVESGLGVRVEL